MSTVKQAKPPVRHDSVRRLFGSAGVYTVANLLTALVPLLLMPVLTRVLPPAEYGLLAMFTVLIGIASPVVGLSVHSAVQRRFYDADIDLPSYIVSTIFILVVSSVAVLAIAYALGRPIEWLSQFPRAWLWAVIVASAAQFIVSLRLVAWQVRKKAHAYGALQLTRALLVLGVSIALVIGLGMGWQGAVLGQVVGGALAAGAALLLLHRGGWLNGSVRREYVMNAIAFGVPLVPHAFARYIMIATDRIFVTHAEGLDATGIYMVATQISLGLNMLFTAFNTAYTPWLYERLAENSEETRLRLVRFTWKFFPIAIGMALVTALIAPAFLEVFVGEAYEGAASLVLWLALGAAFNGMYLMVTNYILYAERTGMLTIATVATALINVPLVWLMVSWNGAVGAAQATMLTLLLKFLTTWWMSARTYPMPWFGRRARG